MRETPADLWDTLTAFDSDSQSALFAHGASLTVNVVKEPRNRQPDASAHGDKLARAVGLNMADFYAHFPCLLDVGSPNNAARALDLYQALIEDAAREEVPSEGFLLSVQHNRPRKTLDSATAREQFSSLMAGLASANRTSTGGVRSGT